MTNSKLPMCLAPYALAAVLLFALSPAQAFYRCVDAAGVVSYTAGTCANPATARELNVSPEGTTSENFVARAAGQYVRLPDSAGFYDRLSKWGSVNNDATPSHVDLSSGAAVFQGNDGSKVVCHAPGAVLSDQMLMAGEDAALLDPRIGKADDDVLPFFSLKCQSIEPKQLEKSAIGPDNALALPISLARVNERSLMLIIRGRTEYVQVYQRANSAELKR